MQCAKPLLILSVTLAANNNIQTPAFEALNKASFAYGSTLGLQRSRKLTQNLVDSDSTTLDDTSLLGLQQGKSTMKKSEMPIRDDIKKGTVQDTGAKSSAITTANKISSELRFEDVSVLGLQRWTTVTKRAALAKDDPEREIKTAELPVHDTMQEDTMQRTDAKSSGTSAGTTIQPALELEDVSVLGLQRSTTLTRRAAPVKDDTEMKIDTAQRKEDPQSLGTNDGNTLPPALELEDVSVLGLQRWTTLTKRSSIPKEDPQIQDADESPSSAGVAGASLLGRQQWTHLSRGQSPPTEDITGSNNLQLEQSTQDSSSNGSSLGLQNSWKLSRRPAVVDDLEERDAPLQVSHDPFEMDLSFEDVSVLGLQRSVQVKSTTPGTTINASKDAVLGLQRFKKLSRGQVAPVEDHIESMVVEV